MGVGVASLDLCALLVAFVALFVAVIPLTQQFLSAASECSSRRLGDWASHAHWRWNWETLRFKVTFLTPKITVDLRSAPFSMQAAGSVPQRPAQRTVLQRSASNTIHLLHKGAVANAEDSRQYDLIQKSGSKWGKLQAPESFDKSEKPWFLSPEPTIRTVQCTWLTLLQDTALTNLQVIITKQDNYITRPIASADRTSFLTLMSLFGVEWKNKGKNRKLSGKGDFCEVSVSHIRDFGDVFSYRDGHRRRADGYTPNSRTFQIMSEKARLAMFHSFDLGFATFKTHNGSELKASLSDALCLPTDREIVQRVVAFYRGSQEWCPGLSESITCWADASMPKVIYEKENRFKSMFSAVSARCLTTGTPQFVAMLLGGQIDHKYLSRAEISYVRDLTEWAKDYMAYSSLELKVQSFMDCLKWAATWSPSYQNNIVDPDIPWKRSLECLEGVRELDTHLEEHLLEGFKENDQKAIKCTISNEQIRYGSSLFTDARDAAETHGSESWLDELDRVGAENYVKIAGHLTDKLQSIVDDRNRNPWLARMIVVNRLMRGSLWVIHNGNAPDQYERVFQCSLSSSWLLENPTVYIS